MDVSNNTFTESFDSDSLSGTVQGLLALEGMVFWGEALPIFALCSFCSAPGMKSWKTSDLKISAKNSNYALQTLSRLSLIHSKLFWHNPKFRRKVIRSKTWGGSFRLLQVLVTLKTWSWRWLPGPQIFSPPTETKWILRYITHFLTSSPLVDIYPHSPAPSPS